ncbi:hypothetical protein BUALT_Bualt11G0057600 [Buddleja alternifolia]|uniref:Protein PLASTID MOVEMENT IMPAIRED 2 n=1 Tax=Buddleja alternifolia TaxID=168488 RepID=A0AAV6WRU4_9LAMI|nr:hypothetical protein BUALT_Bualt11G0057600 [Buddleja alternifolia]
MMNGDKLQERKIGTVKAAISSYRERIVEGNPTNKNFQPNYPQKPHNKTRELHQAKRETNQFNESTKLAESAKAEAQSKLSAAKKTVKDLTRKIEESSSRATAQTMYLEKLKMAKRKEVELNSIGNSQCERVMRDLESIKQELSKLKLDISSLLEERRRSEQETESSMLKVISYSNSIETLTKEIEEINDEHVLVELARIEAIKEYREIESERRKKAEKYLGLLEEAEKKRQNMIQEIENSKYLETKLAITISDIDMLENELKQVKEIDIGPRFVEDDESSLLELVKTELEAAKKELDSIKEESFQFMASMDVVRNELRHVIEETSRFKEKDEKTDLIIQNLNSKLLRAKDKLEAVSEAAERAKSMESNLSLTLQQLQSETESAKEERSLIIVETSITKAEIQKNDSETDIAEEKLQAAIQELKAVKSSEAVALDNLKALIERTIRNRASASKISSTITISKFEYDYLTGHAAGAIDIADKKVEAAKAWVEALKASEKEIMIKTDLLRRESREIKVERHGKKLTADDREFEKWMEKMESGNNRSVRKKVRKFASPVVHGGTPQRSTSFTVGRRKKVMPNLAKFLSGRSIERKV